MDYKTSGVDIDKANTLKSGFKEILFDNPSVLNKVGAFASISDFSKLNFSDPVIVTKTEEPGSKQLLAFGFDMYESICYDMINHLVNDCIMVGAHPFVVQDCIVCGKLENDKVKRMVKAMVDACQSNSCTLVGGETSEQPGVIPVGTYILSSSIVGIVDRSKIIDGSSIKEGDVVIAISSNGPHTNGYTLIRAILIEHPELMSDQKFMQNIMKPHTPYYKALCEVFSEVNGMAHITGGGIGENLDRVLPENVNAVVDLNKIKVLDVFKRIKDVGKVSDQDMLRTFNMGVGVTVVVSPEKTNKVIDHLSKFYDTYKIGVITKGCKKVVFENSLDFTGSDIGITAAGTSFVSGQSPYFCHVCGRNPCCCAGMGM